MKEVFELVKVDKAKAILKVKELDNLTIAEYPFLNSKMEYITATRGKDAVMTVINKDGSTWHADLMSGYYFDSKSTNDLKKAVKNFFQSTHGILLGLCIDNDEIDYACIFQGYRFWQLVLKANGKEQNLHLENCNTLEDAMKESEKYTGNREWIYKRARTGIDTWEANFN